MEPFEMLESVLSVNPMLVSLVSVLGGLLYTGVLLTKACIVSCKGGWTVAKWALRSSPPGKLAVQILGQLDGKCQCTSNQVETGKLIVYPKGNSSCAHVTLSSKSIDDKLSKHDKDLICAKAAALIGVHLANNRRKEEETLLKELAAEKGT